MAVSGVSEISSVLGRHQAEPERSELLIEIRLAAGRWRRFRTASSAVRAWLFGKATTIYGGSTEIQNNIIAKRVLGMLDHQ